MNKLVFALISLALITTKIYADDTNNDAKLGMIHCCVQSDVFMWGIASNIRQNATQNDSEVIFINAQGSQDKQIEAVTAMQAQNVGALLMSVVIDDTLAKPFQKELIGRLNANQIPVVFYLLSVENRFLKEHKNAYRVGSIPAQSGILQGEMVLEQWPKNKQWDRNGDGIIQYAILKGPAGNPDAEERTKWVRATLRTAEGIKSEEVTMEIANFMRQQAKEVVHRWIDNGTMDKIEVIVANNDDMMLGAHDVLMHNTEHNPALFGIDALPRVLDLIIQDEVAGTVLQDTKAQALNAYQLAANLAQRRDNLEYKLDYPLVEQELIVPYISITKNNVNKFR